MPNFENLISSYYRHVKKFPNKPAVFNHDKSEEWTWSELDNFKNNFYFKILNLGSRPDVCIVFTINSPAIIAMYVGCWVANCAVLPANLRWTQNEFLKIKNRFLASNQSVLVIIQEELLKELPWLEGISNALIISAQKAIELKDDTPLTNFNSESVALYLLTSGTTAEPRILGFDHNSLFEGAMAEIQFEVYTKSDRVCNLRPHYTSAGLNTLWPFFILGYQLIFSNQISQIPVWRFFIDLIQKTKPSLVVLSPTYILELLRHNEEFTEKVNTKLYFGGNALSEPYIDRLINLGFKPAMRYGMTEFVRIVSKFSYVKTKITFDKTNVGQPASDIELRNTNEGLSIKGAGLYSHTLESSGIVKHNKNRWYQTYDQIVTLDKDGIRLKGRNSTFVSIRGFTFNIIEVESVLRQLNAVQDCLVLKSESKDELYAFVLVKDKNETEMIKQHCRYKLSDFKRPQLILLEKWPESANGKIDISALKKIINVT